MRFKKGHKINLGKKASVETRLKMSIAKKGKVPKNLISIREKAWVKNKGRHPWNYGRHDLPPHSIEHRRKVSDSMRGSKNHWWKGGTTEIKKTIRASLEYRLWRESVFKRDNWTCVFCGRRNRVGDKVILNADHIKPFALYPELRFAIDNGRTLCVECHMKTETFGINQW